MAEKKRGELYIVTKAKDLCTYIFTVTHKSPKFFRFSLVSRMHNLSLGVIEKVYRANEIFMKEADESMIRERLGLQKSALTDVKLLSFMALVAMEQNCILPKHFENISKLTTECQYLLAGWIRSDKRYINSRVVKKDFL